MTRAAAALSLLAGISILAFAPKASATDTYGSAEVISVGSTTTTVTGSTAAAASDYTASCGGSAGSRDRVYKFTLSSAATVTIDTVGSQYDTVVHLRNASYGEVACDDDSAGSLKSKITRSLAAGTYYIVVDGYSTGSAGTYTLNVKRDWKKGVAFVHGTGKQTNALDDYWTSENVNSIRNGNAYTVVNCDFEQYMWNAGAAGCLATQLQAFIEGQGIDEMTVITHSNGGNVMRWILSNPTSDSRYPGIIAKTKQVIAVAPSSAGTPLANAVISGSCFEAALGWIMGYINDAVRMQQTSWMASYNASNLYGTAGRPALPVPFKAIVGTDVESSPFDGDSYCGSYTENVGLDNTQAWLNDCSDGFLDCSSQAAAGTVLFYDTSRTEGGEPLSHGQSRRNCFGLDGQLRSQL